MHATEYSSHHGRRLKQRKAPSGRNTRRNAKTKYRNEISKMRRSSWKEQRFPTRFSTRFPKGILTHRRRMLRMPGITALQWRSNASIQITGPAGVLAELLPSSIPKMNSRLSSSAKTTFWAKTDLSPSRLIAASGKQWVQLT